MLKFNIMRKEPKAKFQKSTGLLSIATALAMSVQFCCPVAMHASTDSDSTESSGTLLLPLTPKIDTNGLNEEAAETSPKQTQQPIYEPSSDGITQEINQTLHSGSDPRKSFELEVDIEDDEDKSETLSTDVSEDTTLKGTIQIVADDTEYDSEKNTFLGTGNAVCIIGGQDSKLEADMILYDQNNEIIDARGHVTILRDGQVTTGKAFKFAVNSDEYLITKPDTEVNGATIVARTGIGANDGMAFKQGKLKLPKPFVFQRNQFYGPVGYFTELQNKKYHPEAYLPANPSFKFKARKMVYEKYKDQGNLTVFGGRMMFGKFGIPMPKMIATITKDGNDVVLPIAPSIGNNLQVGGLHFGPKFTTMLPNNKGTVSWSPMIQVGGRTLDGVASSSNGSGIGLSGRATISTKKLKANIAAGSVNNLMVADLHYRINKTMRLQSGINRFMDDGMFGFRRARLAAEVVDTRTFSKVPFLSFVGSRSSFGWMQDNPQLVNLNPEYADLFGGTQTTKIMNSGFKLQQQITATTHPIFALGDDKYGVKSYIYGGVAARGYSSGDLSLIGQLGPILDIRLNRVKLNINYNQSAVRGDSPFVFDQFIQGQRSVNMMGDVKVSKYLTLGGGLGYNLTNKLFYSKTITAAIGPEDFKVLLTRDMVRGMNRVGFDILYGAPVKFNSLVMKGRPDHGQLGGI